MDQKSPLISIIVPIYNVEKYLRECLDSIMKQTFTDWECILVNDGSPDGSLAIINEYCDRDSRFKVINRENGGLSAARNSALSVVKGRYIGFVDADDWIDPEMYQELYSLITQNDADMAQVGYLKEYKGMTHKKPLVHESCVLGHTELVEQLFYDKRLPSYMWNKLFRREVISEPFPEGKVFEDLYIFSYWIHNIDKGAFSPKLLYHYRYRLGSVAHSNSISNRLQYFEACIERANTLDRNEVKFLTPKQREKVLWKAALVTAKVIARMRNHSKAERIAALEQVKQDCEKHLSSPQRKTLGFVKYHKAKLLCRRPEWYIRMSLALKYLDLHSRYRIERAFD